MSDNIEERTFTWEIENFSMLPHQFGENMESKKFGVEQWKNMRCYFLLYPRGHSSGEGHISLYLFATAADRDLKLTFSLTVVSTEPASDQSTLLENRVMFEGHGVPKYMSLNEIYTKHHLYLPNDTLTLRCCVKLAEDLPEDTIAHYESESGLDFLRSCKSRTSIPVDRRSITLPIHIKEHGKQTDFVFTTASTRSAGLQITFRLAKLVKDCVEIEICQTDLQEERLFAKCKMTVVSAHREYQHSEEGYHYFESSLDDIWHFPAFLKTSDLNRDKYLYLDDTLLLQCEFAFSCRSSVYHLENNHAPLIFETKEDQNVSELVTCLEDLYASGKLCDVQLRAGDQTFPAHKVVLCAASHVFRAIFEDDSEEKDSSVVEVEDVDPDTLRSMLALVYSDTLKEDLPLEHASKLFSATVKYKFEPLRRRCSIVLTSSLSVASVCDVLVLADAYQDNFLLTAVHNFIRNHVNQTFHSEQWMRFVDLNPKLSGEIMHQMLIKKQQ